MNSSHELSTLLLDQANSRLSEAGFATQLGELNGTPWLLAESDWFAVGIIAPKDLSEAMVIEPVASAELANRLSLNDAGAKRWDAYLALLLQEPVDLRDEAGRRSLDELQYNTRGVRRLVATGVHDADGLDAALRPLLPLPLAAEHGLPEPFADLASQLVVNGIDPDEAERTIAAFRQSGNLDDV